MAIYSCNISNVSRSNGSNACATLSYIGGFEVVCERTDAVFNYGRKQRVISKNMYLPNNENIPNEWNNPIAFFNDIEKYEKRSNARPAKKVIVALPKEFNQELQQKAIDEYCQTITSLGYGCFAAIHYDSTEEGKPPKNPHAHILIGNRTINKKGKFSSKSKNEYVLDENENRIPLIDEKTGKQKVDSRNRKQWKRRTIQYNPLDEKKTLITMRENWETVCNQYLDEQNQISCKSNKERGIEYIPTLHEGYATKEMVKRGEVSERHEKNQEIRKINEQIKETEEVNERYKQWSPRIDGYSQRIGQQEQRIDEIKRELNNTEQSIKQREQKIVGFSRTTESANRNIEQREQESSSRKQSVAKTIKGIGGIISRIRNLISRIREQREERERRSEQQSIVAPSANTEKGTPVQELTQKATEQQEKENQSKDKGSETNARTNTNAGAERVANRLRNLIADSGTSNQGEGQANSQPAGDNNGVKTGEQTTQTRETDSFIERIKAKESAARRERKNRDAEQERLRAKRSEQTYERSRSYESRKSSARR